MQVNVGGPKQNFKLLLDEVLKSVTSYIEIAWERLLNPTVIAGDW